ncbi:MAG TPA: hypothetical protein VFC62_01690 [Atopostipes sp.]|nr:hypothetical protein [Atopostipes sp.]
MLYRDYETNEWKLMPLKATFLQHEKEHEQYVIDEDDLSPYEEMAHIDNLEFEEVEYDQDVINRLDEVKDYPASEAETVNEYVLNDNILEGTSLALKKQNDLLEASILEMTLMFMGGM